MKLRYIIISLLFTVLGIFLFCGEDPSPVDEGDDPVYDSSIIGVWVDTLDTNSSAGLLKKNIIGIELTDTIDSTFLLFAIEIPDKYIYKHDGKWEITGNSLILSGINCQIIDKNTGSLKTADDTTCNKIITIDTTGTTAGIWDKKQITEFADVWQSITISNVFVNWLKSLSLELKKRKDS